MQVLDLGSHDYEAEDRKDLIGVKNPLLTFQTIHVVKLLNLLVHHLRTVMHNLHLTHRSQRTLQLVQNQFTITVRLRILNQTALLRFKTLNLLLNLSRTLNSPLIKTKSFLNIKVFRRITSHPHDNLLKILLSLLVKLNNGIENSIVKSLLLKENTLTQTQNVILVSNKRITERLPLTERIQIVIVEYSLLHNYHKLVHTVHQLTNPKNSLLRIVVCVTNKIDKF